MSKPTLQDKLAAIENVQLQIKIFFGDYAPYEKDNVLAEMNRIYQQLERRKQNLIHPKPRKPQAPLSTTVTVSGKTANAIERRGRVKP